MQQKALELEASIWKTLGWKLGARRAKMGPNRTAFMENRVHPVGIEEAVFTTMQEYDGDFSSQQNLNRSTLQEQRQRVHSGRDTGHNHTHV